MKCIEDEIPFEVPKGWEWCRLSNIVQFINGDRGKNYPSKSDYLPNGIPWINTGHILDEGTLTEKEMLFISQEKYDSLHSGKIAENDLVLCLRGATFGKVARVKPYKIGAIASSLVIIRCYEYSLAEYLYYYLRSDLAIQQLHLYDNGSAQPNLAAGDVQKYLFPLPPIKEALMISERISILLALVSKISQEKRNLNAIIVNIKTKILDLAIRGQLVPQNPDDEPASALLERIRIEKEELIKQGKIKRDKKESIIFKGEDNSYYVRKDAHTEPVDEQFIFELPDIWEWCSLLNIAKVELGKTLDRAKNTGINHPYLRSVNICWNKVDLTDLNEMRFEPEELERYTIRRNDLLICEGGDVGRSCVWTAEDEIQFQNALHRVRFYGGCNPFYFMYYMMYYENRGIIKALCKGVTIKHLTRNILSLIPFALPPLEEQNRIVERLKQIFSLLDNVLCE